MGPLMSLSEQPNFFFSYIGNFPDYRWSSARSQSALLTQMAAPRRSLGHVSEKGWQQGNINNITIASSMGVSIRHFLSFQLVSIPRRQRATDSFDSPWCKGKVVTVTSRHDLASGYPPQATPKVESWVCFLVSDSSSLCE